jgi:hypothetical protein
MQLNKLDMFRLIILAAREHVNLPKQLVKYTAQESPSLILHE